MAWDDVPRLAEHAYMVYKDFLVEEAEDLAPWQDWDDLPPIVKQAHCEAITEVLHRQGP